MQMRVEPPSRQDAKGKGVIGYLAAAAFPLEESIFKKEISS
jgi:hypothetical protein